MNAKKSISSKNILVSILSLSFIGITVFGWYFFQEQQLAKTQEFDGTRAYQYVMDQMSMGPRTIGSAAHAEAVDWMVKNLKKYHWNVDIQKTELEGVPIQNVVAKIGSGLPWLILAAHYDSRLLADRDPDPKLRASPVPGANDGASGVAVLLELARVLPRQVKGQVWLVFLDAEDNGTSSGSGWILGSTVFVKELKEKTRRLPDSAIIIDMIGDKDLNIYKEKNSNPELTDAIWNEAARLGYDQFIPQYKYRMVDDHLPFLEANIPAVDIIDFDYPYWHTSQDTADKVSADSLQVVGDTLIAWLQNR